jgi:Skp family chaperone for outer membrane proteins
MSPALGGPMVRISQLLAVIVCAMTPAMVFAQTATPAVSPAAAIRLGCVSPQRAFAESADGKAANARLSALREEKARAVEDRQKALDMQERAFQQSATVLNDEARTQRGNAVERFRIDVQRFIQDAQAELLGAQRELENAFVFKFKPALEKVAKDKGLQIVFNLDEGGVEWFDPSLDITLEVVRQIDLAPARQ